MSEHAVKKEKKEKEITVIQDSAHFVHLTGDTYEGFFEAKKKDKSVKMNGPGVYTTAEGDVYFGYWLADKLGNPDPQVTITYHNGSKYEGTFKDWCYFGKGVYTYPDRSNLSCNFIENCPVGELKLTDPNNHIWYGKSETGFAWFDPVNHYYDILEETIEKPKRKKRAVLPSPPTQSVIRLEPVKKKVHIKP